MLLAVGASKPSSSAMARRSSGSVAPATAPEPNGTNIQPLAAVTQPVRIAQKHFDIGQQPVRNQHRLRALQVGVGGHRCSSSLFCPVEGNAQPLRQIGAYLVDRGAHVETQVGRNLLIAAASAVQLVSRVANQCDQLLFDEVVHVFGFAIVEKCR